MKKRLLTVGLAWVFVFCFGCDSFRFAPGEAQRQNAWLHNRTAQMAADTARAEDASEQMQGLTGLCELQSRAFCADYGLPKDFPPAGNVEAILAEANFTLADTAISQSSQRPDAWEMADGAIELGIAVAALFGGVYGTRAIGFLKHAREKSKALQEIIEGNEYFKRTSNTTAESFKAAHKGQSPTTRQIVSQVKSL